MKRNGAGSKPSERVKFKPKVKEDACFDFFIGGTDDVIEEIHEVGDNPEMALFEAKKTWPEEIRDMKERLTLHEFFRIKPDASVGEYDQYFWDVLQARYDAEHGLEAEHEPIRR